MIKPFQANLSYLIFFCLYFSSTTNIRAIIVSQFTWCLIISFYLFFTFFIFHRFFSRVAKVSSINFLMDFCRKSFLFAHQRLVLFVLKGHTLKDYWNYQRYIVWIFMDIFSFPFCLCLNVHRKVFFGIFNFHSYYDD